MHRLWKLWWSEGVGWKPAEVRRLMRSFVVFMISLLDTIAAASDFCEFVGEWAGKVSREDCYKLMAVGNLACEFIVYESAWEIKVAEEELVEAVAVRSIGEVRAENEGTVGCVGCPCVGVIVGFTQLAAAIDGEAGGYDAVGFLLDQHLAAEELGFGLDTGTRNEFEGLISVEVFAQFFRYPCGNVWGR